MANDKKSLQEVLDGKDRKTTAETQSYELREGKKFHIHDGKVIKPGGTVELTKDQFESFKDKFKESGQSSKVVEDVPTVTRTVPSGHAPQDVQGRELDAAVTPVNPLNKVTINPRT